MFRKMRRKKQELTEKQCLDILRRAKTATLALSGDDGYPYSVPMNFVYEDGKIYFKQIDGSFGEGIELPAQSSVFINGIVQGTINLDACLFVLEENCGETICGDYEAYIDYLAKHQSMSEECI